QKKTSHSFLTEKSSSGIWRSKLAWFVALFMGLQSLMFYVTISWLAEIVLIFGFSQATSGYFVAYVQVVGIPVSFIMPILALKLRSQSALVFTINLLYIIGTLMLLWNSTFIVVVIAVGLIGLASSSNFALALTFLSIRAKNAKDSAELSGMAQSVGYILAATGPIFIGYLFDLTGSWTWPLISLII